MRRAELIGLILKHIEFTHNDKDKKDLVSFSLKELENIYEQIKEDNK